MTWCNPPIFNGGSEVGARQEKTMPLVRTAGSAGLIDGLKYKKPRGTLVHQGFAVLGMTCLFSSLIRVTRPIEFHGRGRHQSQCFASTLSNPL